MNCGVCSPAPGKTCPCAEPEATRQTGVIGDPSKSSKGIGAKYPWSVVPTVHVLLPTLSPWWCGLGVSFPSLVDLILVCVRAFE